MNDAQNNGVQNILKLMVNNIIMSINEYLMY